LPQKQAPPWYKNSCVTGALKTGAIKAGIDAIGFIPEAGGCQRLRRCPQFSRCESKLSSLTDTTIPFTPRDNTRGCRISLPPLQRVRSLPCPRFSLPPGAPTISLDGQYPKQKGPIRFSSNRARKIKKARLAASLCVCCVNRVSGQPTGQAGFDAVPAGRQDSNPALTKTNRINQARTHPA
jgi:hypothetical protein